MSDQLPVKVQLGNFGARVAAPVGGTVTTGRTAQPRPVVLQRGPAQGRERFTDDDGNFDPGVARALNKLQAKIDASTAPSRADPLANGLLYQGVQLQGPQASGLLAARPSTAGLAVGYMYWDTGGSRPIFWNGVSWQDTAGGFFAGTTGTQVFTTIDHGFGTPAVGFLITNVYNGQLTVTPQLSFRATTEDNNRAIIWTPYQAYGTKPVTADIYLFR